MQAPLTNEVYRPMGKQAETLPIKKIRKKKMKRWTKPEGMPKRPLSAYNLFFAEQRQQLIQQRLSSEESSSLRNVTKKNKTKVKLGFANLARTVAANWKMLSPSEKTPYTNSAAREQARYKAAVKEWQERGLDPRKAKTVVKKSAQGDQRNSCQSHVCYTPMKQPARHLLQNAGLRDFGPGSKPNPMLESLQLALDAFDDSKDLEPLEIDPDCLEPLPIESRGYCFDQDLMLEPLPFEDLKPLAESQFRETGFLFHHDTSVVNGLFEPNAVGPIQNSVFARSA